MQFTFMIKMLTLFFWTG